MMNFESLPNEILFDLLEFFNGVHLFRAFYNLNTRFNTLLIVHFQCYHFNFQNISKSEFDLICENKFLSIIDRVISLSLSDDDETPNQLDQFRSYGFTFTQLTNLRSLSLIRIRPQKKIEELLTECLCLQNLTHLRITECYWGNENDFIGLINRVWSLSKLTNCVLSGCTLNGDLTSFSTISSTIEYLVIKGFIFSSDSLMCLFKHTPCLQNLNIRARLNTTIASFPTIIPPIISLNITMYTSEPIGFVRFLKNMPHLRYLIVRINDFFLNGHEWKQVIVEYLPNIRVLRFLMEFKLRSMSDADIDKLMETFSTTFWLRQHRWFVRCEWVRRTSDYKIHVYTLPYKFDGRYLLNQKTRIRSTCLDEWNYWSYTFVHDIFFSEDIEDGPLFPIRFFNVQFIGLLLPMQKRVWSIVPTLDHLKSLEIHMMGDPIESELQTLLDRAPHLYSILVYNVKNFLRMTLTNRSVRRLELGSFGDFPQPFLKPEECSLLVNSSLGCQCEVLSVSVTNRTSILELINAMPHLRALICSVSEDFFKNRWSRTSIIVDDELLEWFQTRLPSTCTVTRDPYMNYCFRLWFSR